MTDVTLLGTGLLGTAVARRLLQTGVTLTAWNRTAARAEPLRADGAVLAPSAADAIAASPVALLFLTDVNAIREVVLERREALAGKTIVQQGTIAPWESRELDADVRSAGGRYLEAPVLGSLPQALAGTLAVLAGGTEEELGTVRGLLERLGSVTLAGEVGKAAALKLALNQLIASLTAAFSTSLAYLRAEGLPVETFLEVLRPSALYASTFDKKLPRMLGDDYGDPNFPARHMLKDVELFVEAAARLGVDTTLCAAAARLAQKTVAIGLGEADYSAVYRAVERASA